MYSPVHGCDRALGGRHEWVTSLTEPEGELVVSVGGEQVHLRPAPHLKQVLCYQRAEVPFCRGRAIARQVQVVCQLVVDAWLVDRSELE